MKKLVSGTAVALALAIAFAGPAEAQPPPVQPGTPQTQSAAPPPYVAPTTTVVKKTTVRRRTRVRSRVSSDNIANQLNAQELRGGGRGAAMAPYTGLGHAAAIAPAVYGPPVRPIPVAWPGYPPPPYFRPP